MMSPEARLAINESIKLILQEHYIANGSLGHTDSFRNCPHPACKGAIEDAREGYEWGSNAMREAWRLTHGDRRNDYGTPAVVFEGYARIWSGLLIGKLQPGITLTAADVTLMMTALKLAREANSPKEDNVVDAYGYLIMHEEVR